MRVRLDRERPEGTNDYLGRDLAHRQRLRDEVMREFSLWGYESVETPIFEYVDTFTNGVHEGEETYFFRMFDALGRTLALRPEMTTPVARIVSTMYDQQDFPIRLAYDAKIYRSYTADPSDPIEATQTGIELIGACAPEADAEMITIMIRTFKRIGVHDFVIAIGHMGLVRAILSSIDPLIAERLQSALIDKDQVRYMKICEENKNSINSELYNAIVQLPKMRGDIEVITSLAALTLPEEARKACEEMIALYAIVTDYHVEDAIRFDLGLYLHHDYYTGIVVEAYAQALGQPIGLGGRYDRLLQRFGMDAPATGFALMIERLTEVIRKKPEAIPITSIHYDDVSRHEALAFSDWLRTKGMRIICEPKTIDHHAERRKNIAFHEIKQDTPSADVVIHDLQQHYVQYQKQSKGGDTSC